MGTPIPRRDEQSVGASEVKTYYLSQEELERYRKPETKGAVEMAKGNPAKVPFTKGEYLQMRLEGKTRTGIYTEHKIHPPDFYAWLEDQGLKDRQVEAQLIDELRGDQSATDEPAGYEPPPTVEQPHETKQLEREDLFAPEEKDPKKPLFEELQQLMAGESVILTKDDRDRMKLALDLMGVEYEIKTITVIKLRGESA